MEWWTYIQTNWLAIFCNDTGMKPSKNWIHTRVRYVSGICWGTLTSYRWITEFLLLFYSVTRTWGSQGCKYLFCLFHRICHSQSFAIRFNCILCNVKPEVGLSLIYKIRSIWKISFLYLKWKLNPINLVNFSLQTHSVFLHLQIQLYSDIQVWLKLL